MTNPKLSIIYDITKRCPWGCKICCMGATSDEAVLHDELSQERKLMLMDEIFEVNKTREVYIDFSGGEIMTNFDNLAVVEKIAGLIGREHIGISCSGYKINEAVAERLSNCVSECEMTMDVPPGTAYKLRPTGYAEAAAKAIPYLKKHGIQVGIQTVLANANCNAATFEALYDFMCAHKVDNWSILRFYPSGRGKDFHEECVEIKNELCAVNYIRKLDEENLSPDKPDIDFHYTMHGHPKHSDVCRCVRKSIGIMPNGDVTACFWAVDADTGIIAPKYMLGSLKTQTLPEILSGDRANYWTSCEHSCELLSA